MTRSANQASHYAAARQAHSPWALSGQVWMRKAFENYLYGGNVEGTVESVIARTRHDIIGFAARRLTRAGLATGAVGDITVDELRLLIERIFGDLPREGDDARIAEIRAAGDGLPEGRCRGLFEAVTLEDASRVARRLPDPDGLSFAVVGDPDGLGHTPGDPATRF
jgi:predicted Zn-dependent peptidase